MRSVSQLPPLLTRGHTWSCAANKPGAGWSTGRIGDRSGIYPANYTEPYVSAASSNRLPPRQITTGSSVTSRNGEVSSPPGSSGSRYSSMPSSRSSLSVDESKSLAFADIAKHQQKLKHRAVQAWMKVYERAIASGNPGEIETAIRRSEAFADAVSSQLAELKKTADRIAKYEMRRLHAQADANMKIKFQEDALSLKTRVADWRRQYRIAKRQAREEGNSGPLFKAYLASNDFPHAVGPQREKMRAILDSLDVWWELPRVFHVSLVEICRSGRVELDASGVPDFFDHWLKQLESTGAGQTEGCFRVPGHQEDVMLLKKYYERDSKATGLSMSQLHSKGRTCHEYVCIRTYIAHAHTSARETSEKDSEIRRTCFDVVAIRLPMCVSDL